MDNGTCNCETLPLLFSRLSLLRLGSAPSVVVPIQTAPASNKFFFTIPLIFIEFINYQQASYIFFFLLFFSNYALRGGGGVSKISLQAYQSKNLKKKKEKKKSGKKKETLKKKIKQDLTLDILTNLANQKLLFFHPMSGYYFILSKIK